MTTIIISLVMLVTAIFPIHPQRDASPAGHTRPLLTVKASPDSTMQTQQPFLDNKTLSRMIRKGAHKTAAFLPVTDTYIIMKGSRNDTTYLVDRRGSLFNPENHERIELQGRARMALINGRETLRSAHYGTRLSWELADKLIPKYSKFTVVDLETGLTFAVQRRAGKDHADVQPLSKADTAVMKQIYNGKWSWNRRAILVNVGSQLLAASMNGMPHGGDGIPENGFSGHFCIHFYGSSTHRLKNVDPEHQLMVFKAAGELDEFFDNASPYQVADTFIQAVNLKERQIAKMSLTLNNRDRIPYFFESKDGITGIRKRSKHVETNVAGMAAVDIPVEVGIFRNRRNEEKTRFLFHMARTSPMDPWKIDSIEVGNKAV